MPTSKHASGTFQVKLAPLPIHEEGAHAALGRMSIDKQFSGELEARSQGEMLTGAGSVQGSAAYVAMERVEGTLHGRHGSFVLCHRGVMNRGVPEQSVSVVPDSGIDELATIAGTMTISITGGAHNYRLEYTLEEKD